MYKYIISITSILIVVLFFVTWTLFIIGDVYIEDPIAFTITLGLTIWLWYRDEMLNMFKNIKS